jgi:DNA-binding phage protein
MEITKDMMQRAGFKEFDMAEFINTPEDARLYLEEVLKDGDKAEFYRALGYIARSKAMVKIMEADERLKEPVHLMPAEDIAQTSAAG